VRRQGSVHDAASGLEPLSAGVTLSGRYRLECVLGSGAAGSVWLAQDDVLGRFVAVKVLSDDFAEDPEWVRRFERSSRAAASLNHPNIVSVFDFGIDWGRPFMVMRYMRGPTLAAMLRLRDRLDPETLARDLLDAVHHIHTAGLLHRNIKPDNVLLDAQRRPLLSDFGVALANGAPRLTDTADVIPTTRYLAPELSRGGRATVSTDLFACGRLLEDVLARHPARGLTALVESLTAEEPGWRPSSAQAAMSLLTDGEERDGADATADGRWRSHTSAPRSAPRPASVE
jgi:serine/threonine protein kinase